LARLSLIINTNLGYAYLFAGQPDEAIAQLRKTLEMDSGFALARAALGQALELKGQIPEAMAEYQKAVALSNDPNSLGLSGHLYGITGRKDEATKILEQLKETRQHSYIDAFSLALVSLGLGSRDQALNWLEQGFQERSSWLIYMRIEPLLRPLHFDPRFDALAEKIVPAAEFKSATASK
jgi:tetratricopeptide (TPR) repeat protein